MTNKLHRGCCIIGACRNERTVASSFCAHHLAELSKPAGAVLPTPEEALNKVVTALAEAHNAGVSITVDVGSRVVFTCDLTKLNTSAFTVKKS